ncbi:DUF188 domain-containing protein [Spirochaeta dissipatitropha]
MSEVRKVYLDADSLPAKVREVVFRQALKGKIKAILVANRPIPHPRHDSVQMKEVASGEGVADEYILGHASPVDLVVTRDIPLAYRLAAMGICVINDRGVHYDLDTARERLSVRNFAFELRSDGIDPGRSSNFGHKELHAFSAMFQQALSGELEKNY